MKAVRGKQGKPVVVDIDEPPGEGELLSMQVGGICASDFAYLRMVSSSSSATNSPACVPTAHR